MSLRELLFYGPDRVSPKGQTFKAMTRNFLASGVAAPRIVDLPRKRTSFQLKVLYTTAAGTLFEDIFMNRITLSESDTDGNFPGDGFIEDAL